MPVASGAAGRAEKKGAEFRTRTNTKYYDSYLQRYKELQRRKKSKSDPSQDGKEKTELRDEWSEGADKGNRQEGGSREDHTSGEPLSGDRSKKSRLCVVL